MWFFYSFFFALWSSVATFLIKRYTGKINPLPLLFILFLFYAPSVFVLLQFVGGIPTATARFYIYMFISAVLDVTAFISWFQAIARSPISLIAPVQSFTPLFTTLIAIVTLGEIPTQPKFLGIVLIVFGAYLLNVGGIKQGVFAPFKELISHKGVQLSLLSTFLWAITPIFQKKAIFETSPQIPLYASFIGICFVTLLLLPITGRSALSYKKEIPKNIKWFLLYGAGGALAQLAAYSAFAITNVGYVASIMRLSGLFTVVIGGTFLKEKRIKERLLGAIVMIVGTIFLAI